MRNNSFDGNNKIFKYSKDTYGFVTNGTIEVGQEVEVARTDGGQPIYKEVIEILEGRKSSGTFKEGTEIPMWYKLKVSA